MDEAIRILQNYEIFRRISQRRLFSLYYYVKEKNFTRRQFIYKQGDPVDGVYLIVTGEFLKLKDESL